MRDHETRERPRNNNGETGAGARMWNVLTVQEKGGRKFWTKIGVAFKNDGPSFRVMLDALPLDGVLYIMPPKNGETKSGAASRR